MNHIEVLIYADIQTDLTAMTKFDIHMETLTELLNTGLLLQSEDY